MEKIKKKTALSVLTWAEVVIISMVAFFIGISSGCSDTVGCVENRSSIPYAGFYSYQTGESITLSEVEIGGIGAPNDSLLMSSTDTYSSLYLPFRFEQNNTGFFIRYVSEDLKDYPELTDTILFAYTSTPYFASAECGAMYNYEITSLEYTRHLVDSIAITDSLITNLDIQRIEIYFNTADSDEEGGEE